MGRNNSRRLSGSRDFRQRLVLATLASTPITIKDICAGEEGLRPHEMSLLHLLDKVSDEHVIDVNDTGKGAPACGFFDLGWLVAGHGWVRSWAGTKVGYKPGVVVGWKDLEHDCGVHRGIGYFIEPLLLLGLFARSPLSARLKGITNDTKDPSVDTFRMVMLHMLKHFGVPLDGMELKIESRGAPPHGGGEVLLRVPNINSTLKAVNWVDEGMVQRIRGVAFSTIVSPRIVSRLWRVCSC